ncbi:type I restriction enzyme HsdR N-terminal domain-containing protein [Nostoc sp. CHAB 5715]|uniref:type I restriction enzyme HsdR N-terminal domain-containing protein n=1 Tax=Nostoc sp. CHAB 5715 TaxID=2780400 RepID=UPI001E6067CB|nr:type I restriction enzyme HsdR N-terminal domain-containing protein [Nostoc sp. CHAB 5715]MCC5624195.1 PD-(D/E)XK nuclease family protein [Nostoc sp. CHAB 5715]
MTTSIAIAEKITTLRQVEEKLGLTLSGDSQFFTEWMADLPGLSEAEQTRLEQVRQNYLYQISDGSLLEETVKMVVLSPLLELAGFYQAPYRFKTEVSVDIVAQGDNDELLRGRIDVLVLQGRLWIVLIESKKTTFDLELAIPQTLAYMAIHPNPEQPLYGMIANGSSYLFVKTLDKQYGISDLFATRSQYLNNLSAVLRIIMHLGRIITES